MVVFLSIRTLDVSAMRGSWPHIHFIPFECRTHRSIQLFCRLTEHIPFELLNIWCYSCVVCVEVHQYNIAGNSIHWRFTGISWTWQPREALRDAEKCDGMVDYTVVNASQLKVPSAGYICKRIDICWEMLLFRKYMRNSRICPAPCFALGKYLALKRSNYVDEMRISCLGSHERVSELAVIMLSKALNEDERSPSFHLLVSAGYWHFRLNKYWIHSGVNCIQMRRKWKHFILILQRSISISEQFSFHCISVQESECMFVTWRHYWIYTNWKMTLVAGSKIKIPLNGDTRVMWTFGQSNICRWKKRSC